MWFTSFWMDPHIRKSRVSPDGTGGDPASPLASSNVARFSGFVALLAEIFARGFAFNLQLRLTLEWARRISDRDSGRVHGAAARHFPDVFHRRTRAYRGGIERGRRRLPSDDGGVDRFHAGIRYSIAASALVGRRLASKDPDRAERYGWAQRGGLGDHDGDGRTVLRRCRRFAHCSRRSYVADLAVSYLRIMAISEPLLAFGWCLRAPCRARAKRSDPPS